MNDEQLIAHVVDGMWRRGVAATAEQVRIALGHARAGNQGDRTMTTMAELAERVDRARVQGAKLLTADGKPFMHRYHHGERRRAGLRPARPGPGATG